MTAGALTYKAVVDWIELEVQLSRHSNFWTVQETVKTALQLPHDTLPFVEALDSGSGNAASVFRFRIQDLNRVRQLSEVMVALQEKFGVAGIRPTGVELAFDTYLQGGTVRQLAEVATNRFKFITSRPADDWYFYRMKDDGRRYLKTLPQHNELVEMFEASWQLTDTNSKDADIRYHSYVKTRDNKKALIPSMYCARLEVTLRSMALPFNTLAELIDFDYASLAHHFKFRRFADDLYLPARHALAKWSGRQLGRSDRYRRADAKHVGKYSGTSVYRSSTVADEELNTAVYEGLRKLTRSWRSRRSRADFPEAFLP